MNICLNGLATEETITFLYQFRLVKTDTLAFTHPSSFSSNRRTYRWSLNTSEYQKKVGFTEWSHTLIFNINVK